MELENIGGKAYKTKATIDTKRLEETLTDPYVTIKKGALDFNEIGIYSIRDSGLEYAEDGHTVTGSENYFEIEIAKDCPDNYLISVNVTIEYYDDEDKKYETKDEMLISVTNRILLGGRIDSDIILPKNTSYILLSTLTITETGSLTIEEGVDIQMYNDTSTSYYGTITNSPKIVNNGTLNINGVDGNMVKIHSSELYKNYVSFLSNKGKGNINYLNAENVILRGHSNVYISNSILDFIIYLDSGTFFDTQQNLRSITNSKQTIEQYDMLNNFNFENCSFSFSNLFFFDFGSISLNNSSLIFDNSNLNIRKASFENSVLKSKSSSVSFTGFTFDNCTFISENYLEQSDFSFYVDAFYNSGNYLKNYSLINITKNTFLDNIHDKNTGESSYEVTITNDGTGDISKIPPYITSVKLYDSNGLETRLIGRETFTVKIDFNTDMDTSLDLNVRFGSVEPYAEYKIEGSYTDKRHWEGTYTLNSRIEGGTQRFNISNARSDTAHNLELADMGDIFTFTIDAAGSLAMSLQAIPQNDGIHLSWMQDDYETIMGYNIYRRDTKDGQSVKINPTLISKDENTYIDTDFEPGKTYWYSFTYILTDLTEGKPSNLVQATAKDTEPPVVRHTPVNQGYAGNNLTITCVARDNVGIKEAKLYFRVKGTTIYNSVNMIKNSDTYIGSIPGNYVTLDGLEYYIEVTDGINIITKQNASNPYSVVIKDASILSSLGDVNGDGIINTKDALMLQQHLTGKIILTDDQFKRGDINKNGQIDAKEVMWILQYVNGNLTSFDNLK